MFATDSGPECGCLSNATLWIYRIDSYAGGDYRVECRCACCGKVEFFWTTIAFRDVREIRAMHAARIKQGQVTKAQDGAVA